MREDYEKTMHHVWLVLEVEKLYKEDYQIRMLSDNNLFGLLQVRGQGADETSRYRYDVTGKTSVKDLWSKEKWGYEHLEQFMRQFIRVLYELNDYLLDLNSLSLKPEHIFREGESFYFCYVPGREGNVWQEFHVLMEEFVKIMDYTDKEGIYLAYELHKASMEENFDIEQVLEQVLEKKEQEMKRVTPEKKRMVYDVAEEKVLDDWTAFQEMKGNTIKERQSVWGFVSKKIRKRQQEEWDYLESLQKEEQQK